MTLPLLYIGLINYIQLAYWNKYDKYQVFSNKIEEAIDAFKKANPNMTYEKAILHKNELFDKYGRAAQLNANAPQPPSFIWKQACQFAKNVDRDISIIIGANPLYKPDIGPLYKKTNSINPYKDYNIWISNGFYINDKLSGFASPKHKCDKHLLGITINLISYPEIFIKVIKMILMVSGKKLIKIAFAIQIFLIMMMLLWKH